MTLSEQDKRKLTVGLIFFVILFGGILYYHLMVSKPYIDGMKEQIDDAKTKVDKLKKELEDIKQMIAMEDEVNRQLKRVEKMISRLPSSADAPGFLNELIDVLRITGAKNQRVIPEKTLPRYLYTEIPYKVTLTSRYHEFGQFLNMIEWNPRRFMRVKGLALKNSEKRPSIHPVEVEIATFMFREASK